VWSHTVCTFLSVCVCVLRGEGGGGRGNGRGLRGGRAGKGEKVTSAVRNSNAHESPLTANAVRPQSWILCPLVP
jgi:hypothetical protein